MADRLALERDLAFAGVDQPADHARGRALARPRLTDQTDALAGAYHHRKVRYRRWALIETFCEFLHLKQWRRTRRWLRLGHKLYRNIASPLLFRHQVRDTGTRRGRSCHKTLGVAMLRSAGESLRLGFLDQAALLHHHDAATVAGGETEVMGDQYRRHAPLGGNAGQQAHPNLFRPAIQPPRRLSP